MASPVLSSEVWNETLAALPEGYIFSSVHQDIDHVGMWKASVVVPPAEPPCACCGFYSPNFTFLVGSGNSPDSALIDLTQKFPR